MTLCIASCDDYRAAEHDDLCAVKSLWVILQISIVQRVSLEGFGCSAELDDLVGFLLYTRLVEDLDARLASPEFLREFCGLQSQRLQPSKSVSCFVR